VKQTEANAAYRDAAAAYRQTCDTDDEHDARCRT
jgi:hypothetical protein